VSKAEIKAEHEEEKACKKGIKLLNPMSLRAYKPIDHNTLSELSTALG